MPKRIDDSHQPYKRTKRLGPGPRRHPPVLQAKNWECSKGKKKYEQICVWVGAGKRAPTKNRMNPKKKKKYNKVYRAWAAKNRVALTKRAPVSGYKCRRTKATRCR